MPRNSAQFLFIPVCLTAALILVGCSKTGGTLARSFDTVVPSEVDSVLNDLEAHGELLANQGLNLPKITENYTPENFGENQRAALELLTPSFREAAEAHLPKRIDQVQFAQSSATFEPDLESVVLKATPYGNTARVQMRVEGDCTYSTPSVAASTKRATYQVEMIVPNLSNIRVSQWTIKVN